jgi:predicted amidophosphoribosyltransferase
MAGELAPLNRTLEQELLALSRGVSLECLVCGEFVLWTGGGIVCPECGARLEGEAKREVQLGLQAG